MKNFIRLKEHGQLYIDRVFVEANYPVLFTCLSEDKTIFICACYRHGMWLIGKTDSEAVIDMLTDRITVRRLFEDASERYSASYDGQWQVTCRDDIWKECMPDDAYICAEGGEFDDDIHYLRQL